MTESRLFEASLEDGQHFKEGNSPRVERPRTPRIQPMKPPPNEVPLLVLPPSALDSPIRVQRSVRRLEQKRGRVIGLRG